MIIYVTNDCDPNTIVQFLTENGDRIEHIRYEKNRYAEFIAKDMGVKVVRTISGSEGCHLALGKHGELTPTD